MAIHNTGLFGNHLDRDVNDLFWDSYMTHVGEYNQIAKIEQAPAGNHYTSAEMSGLGHLRLIDEGDAVEFDTMVEGHKKVRYYKEYGLGGQITKHMYKDDLFGHFKQIPRALAKSAAQKPEVEFFNLFNNGFDSEESADGQYIFDTDHTTLKSGETISNDPTASSLSETTLQAAFEYFEDLVDEAGMPLDFNPEILLVPTELQWTAYQLLGSPKVLGSANNDPNTVFPNFGRVPGWRVHVSKYLTDSNAWFLIAREHQAMFLWKDQIALTSADDFYTDSALFKVTERFATFVTDYKGLYGNAGA